jgi:hypothetical protein
MNGNKKINNLKKLIVIISIAILIVGVVLVMSIYNNKFGKIGDDGIKGGRSTASTTSAEVLFDSDETTETTTTTIASEEETTNASSQDETPAKTTTTIKTTRTTRQTVAPTSGTVVVTTPAKNYTVITSGGTGATGASKDLEWEIFNYINSKRNKKFKMAAELRQQAENAARTAVDSFQDSIDNNNCNSSHQSNCKCNFGGLSFDGAGYCSSDRKDASYAGAALMKTNSGVYDEDYEYIGVGVIANSEGHYSYVIIFD